MRMIGRRAAAFLALAAAAAATAAQPQDNEAAVEAAAPVPAAQATPPRDEATTGAAADPLPVEEVVVVGTTIKGGDIAGGLPVTVLSESEIEAAADQTFEELLKAIPQTGAVEFNSGAETTNNARGHIASLNLRTLGADTALVLVNGRRMVKHPQTQTFSGVPVQFVNMSAIPTAGLARIEILRDGASALYGSDAVAGVLNAVVRDNYEGMNARVRYGAAQGTGQDEWNARVYGGTAFNDGQGSVSFSVQYLDRTGLDASELDHAASANHQFDSRLSPDDPFFGSTFLRNTSTSSPFGEFTAGTASSATVGGIIGERVEQDGKRVTSTDGLFHLQPAGLFPNESQSGVPLAHGVEIDDGSFTSRLTTTGNGIDVAVNGRLYPTRPLNYDQNATRTLISSVQRLNAAAVFSHEIGDALEVFGDVIYFSADSRKVFGPPVLTTVNNFVIPANYFWNPLGPTMLTDGSPNPNRLPGIDAPDEGLDISVRRYRFDELGPRTVRVDLRQARVLAGVRGEAGAWDWDSAIGHSRSKATDTSLLVSRSLLHQELSRTDAEALNVFDGPDIIDVYRARTAGFGVDATRDSVNTLTTWDLRVSTPDLFPMPGGYAGFGWGLEWRRESTEDDRDPRLDGSTPFTNPLSNEVFEGDILGVSATSDIAASRHVFSGYAEAILPLFTNTAAGSAKLQAAARVERHRGIDETALKPRLLVTWEPTPWLSLRGAFSLGFRAPSLVQTTTPEFSRFSNFQEDWSRCTFVQRRRGEDCFEYSVTARASGNPELEPETSRNLSGGIVLSPTDSLLFTIDYWSIDIENTVATVGRNDQIAIDEYLRRTAGTFNPDVVRADPTESRIESIAAYNQDNGTDIAPFGNILHVRQTFLNLHERRASGLDFYGKYVSPSTRYGRFRASLNAALLLKFEQDPLPQLLAPLNDEIAADNLSVVSLGDLREALARPKWRASAQLSWRYENVSLGLGARYVGPVLDPDFTATADDGSTAVFEVDSWHRLDAFAEYRFRSTAASTAASTALLKNARLRVGFRNLTDKEPPLADNSKGFIHRLHSITPRFFYVDFRKRFQ